MATEVGILIEGSYFILLPQFGHSHDEEVRFSYYMIEFLFVATIGADKCFCFHRHPVFIRLIKPLIYSYCQMVRNKVIKKF